MAKIFLKTGNFEFGVLPEDTVIISRGVLNAMLHRGEETDVKRQLSHDAETQLAIMYLANGKNVVINREVATEEEERWGLIGKDLEAQVEKISTPDFK